MTKMLASALLGWGLSMTTGLYLGIPLMDARPGPGGLGRSQVGMHGGIVYDHQLTGEQRSGHLFGFVNRHAGLGPQALEGYAYDDHREGVMQLALGTTGTVELAGEGETISARGLGGGVVFTGPGYAHHVTSLSLAGALRHSAYKGPINVGRVDYITFGNGWSIRPDGLNLVICDRESRCRPL